MKITTIGIDLAKAVFQIHGVDERGKVVAAQATQARRDVELLRQPGAMPDRHGSLRQCALLGEEA